MKKTPRIVTLAILLAFVLAGISCNRSKEVPKLTPEQSRIAEDLKKSVEESKKAMVAKVNGADISMYDLINEMNAIAPHYIKSDQKRDPETDEKIKKDALDRLIYRELAVQEAVRQGMKVRPEPVENELKKLKANLKSEDAYKQYLAKSGLTEEGIKKKIERGFLVEMITEKEIFDKIKVDPELVKKTYAKEKASYKGASGKQMSFEEARPLIEEELMTTAVHKREDQWVEELKKTARIEITLAQSAKGIHSTK